MKEYCLVPKPTVDRHLVHAVSDPPPANGNDNTNKINDKSILEPPPDVSTLNENTVMSGGGPAGGACERGRGGGGGCCGGRGARGAGNRRAGGRSLIISRCVPHKKKNKNAGQCDSGCQPNAGMNISLPSIALEKLGKTTSPNNRNTSVNPSLEHLVGIFFKASQQEYAKSLLEFYRQQSLIRWDELGQIQSPVPGLNILDVIKYFASSSSFSIKEKELLKILHNFAPVPYDYIRNSAAKRYLTGVHKAGGNVKGKPIAVLTSVQRKMRWNPY